MSSKEDLEKLETKIAQLQAQKKALKQKEKLKEKQERTTRLIKYGELLENYLNERKIPLDKQEEFLKGVVLINCNNAPPNNVEGFLKEVLIILQEKIKSLK